MVWTLYPAAAMVLRMSAETRRYIDRNWGVMAWLVKIAGKCWNVVGNRRARTSKSSAYAPLRCLEITMALIRANAGAGSAGLWQALSAKEWFKELMLKNYWHVSSANSLKWFKMSKATAS